MKPTQSRIIGYEKEFKTTLKKIRTKFKKYKKNKSDLFNHVSIHNEKNDYIDSSDKFESNFV